MVFIDKMQDITSVMDEGGLVLMPTDASWSIAGDAYSEFALEKILNLKKDLSKYPITLLVNSLEMFKYYFPYLHPRIETLLSLHERPLTLILPVASSNVPNHLKTLHSSVAIRLSYDNFCNTIIDLINGPLIITAARSSMNFPTSFSEISTSIIEKMDYVCRHKIEQSGFYPEVVAQYNDLGELEFLRE